MHSALVIMHFAVHGTWLFLFPYCSIIYRVIRIFLFCLVAHAGPHLLYRLELPLPDNNSSHFPDNNSFNTGHMSKSCWAVCFFKHIHIVFHFVILLVSVGYFLIMPPTKGPGGLDRVLRRCQPRQMHRPHTLGRRACARFALFFFRVR